MDFESETFLVSHSLRGEGFDVSEDGTGRGTPLVPVAYRVQSVNSNAMREGGSAEMVHEAEIARALDTNGGFTASQGGNVVLAFDPTQVTSATNRSNPQPGDPCHPIAAGSHAPAIAFGWQNSSQQGASASASASHTPTLDKSKVPGIAYSTKLHNTTSNQAGKLYQEYTAGLDRNSPPPALLTTMQVRRLTPRECERLQGFPDDYTLIPHRGKPAADGPRYKALGNSWAVPCARWIGERIQAVEAIHAARREAA